MLCLVTTQYLKFLVSIPRHGVIPEDFDYVEGIDASAVSISPIGAPLGSALFLPAAPLAPSASARESQGNRSTLSLTIINDGIITQMLRLRSTMVKTWEFQCGCD